MQNLYPTTSNRLSIRKNNNFFLAYDTKIKKWIDLNQSMNDLLLLCNGQNSIEEIVLRLMGVYKENQTDIDSKVKGTIKRLEIDGFVRLNTEKTQAQARFREYNYRWPLESAFIELTKKCNLKCIHCYNESSSQQDFGLNKKDLFYFIDQLDEMSIFQVNFTGGEPMLRKDFDEIVEYIYNKGIELGILTNGMLIDQNKIDLFKKINPKFIAISLESLDNRVFKEIRGVDNQRVIENIKILREAGLNVRINTVFFKGLNDSYESILDIIKFAAELGIKDTGIAFDEFIESGRGAERPNYSLNQNEILDKIKKAFLEVYNSKYVTKPAYQSDSKKQIGSFCGVGESIFYLDSKGNVTLCTIMNDERFKAGNIFSNSVMEIWENSDIFKYFREKKHILNTECEDCPTLPQCAGGGKAKSAVTRNNFNRPDYWMCAYFDKSSIS